MKCESILKARCQRISFTLGGGSLGYEWIPPPFYQGEEPYIASYVSYLWATLWRAIPRHMHAGHPVASLYLPQLRYHFLTLCGSHPAAGMEHASSWRIQRAGHLSREEYPLSLRV